MTVGRWCTDAEYDEFKTYLVREAKGDPKCTYCGQAVNLKLSSRSPRSFSIDHIKSKEAYPKLAKQKSNMVISCKGCNSSKGTKTREQFLAEQARKVRGTRPSWAPIGGN